MSYTVRPLGLVLVAMLLALPLASVSEPVAAQSRATKRGSTTGSTATNVPNALQGFSRNRHQPIHIEASSLEIQDKSKMATFRGNVYVKQGDTELRCNVLVVHYEQDGDTSRAPQSLAATDTQRIRLLEAKGNVVVKQQEQIAKGDTGVFDMRKNTITLRGHVVISQGPNVLRGDRLVVNMTTAVSRIESDSGRVQGLFQPSAGEEGERRGGSSIMPRLR